MPEDMGTVVVDPQLTDASDGEETKVQSPEPFLRTYKSKEEAEKGFEELNAALNRTRSERDKAVNENKQLALLQQIVEQNAQAAPTKQSESDALEYWEKRIEEDGTKAIFDFQRAVLSDSEKAQQDKIEKLMKDFDSKYDQLAQQVKQQNPDVLQHGEKAQELAAQAGSDWAELNDSQRDIFLKIAKVQAKPSQPARPDLPGNSATPARTANQASATLSPADRAMIEAMTGKKLTDDEAKKLASVHADTANRRRNGRS